MRTERERNERSGKGMAEMTNPAPRRRSRRGLRFLRTRTAIACGVLVLGALGLGGCASVRNDLGTVSSGCYVDLALASHAVHHHGRLRGVRLVPVASLRPHEPLLFDAAEVRRKRLGQVCLVAFGGQFHSDLVDHPIGEPTGKLAVVELGYPNRKLLATLIVTRPPLAFGHSHL